MRDLRPHPRELRVEFALLHLEFGFPLDRAWGVVVAVANEHAVDDRVAFNLRFLEPLLRRRLGGGRSVEFVIDPIAFGARNKARLLQVVAALLGCRRLRYLRARGIELSRLPRKPGVDQLEAPGAIFLRLQGDRV